MGRGRPVGYHMSPEQRQAISAKMKGKVRAKAVLTPEQQAAKAKKLSELNKQRWANMTPEEREAISAKHRHPHNMSKEGSQRLADSINDTRAAGNLYTNRTIQRTQETNSMMTTTNEVAAYIDQLKAKARLFASTFEKQPIENLVKIDAFLSAMLPGNTEVTAHVGTVTGWCEEDIQRSKRKYTRRSGGGLSKYKEPFQAYKSNGGKLKWREWLKFAKTGTFPSPIDPIPQNQQVADVNGLM